MAANLRSDFGGEADFVDQTRARSTGSGGGGFDARLGKLESHVEYIQRDIGDIKGDLRRVASRVDEIKDSIASTKVWALLLYFGLAGSLFYTLARGFKWI